MFNARTAPIETATDQGGRDYQQDRAAFARESGHLVAAVADGMGSGKNSDRIAELAATLATRIAWTYGPAHPEYAVTAAAECVRALTDADRGECDNTTLVLATVETSGAVTVVRVAWVGDSRAYVLTRRGRLIPLTKDHNRAPWAPNVLTRSLLGDGLHHQHERGSECVRHEPEAAEYADIADPAVTVALMSDGVCGVLSDGEIAEVLRGAPNPRRAARRLVGQALQCARLVAERPDNATALVVDLATEGR